MDPTTIQPLSIGPADWAALLDGFVGGVGYEAAGVTVLVLVAAVLIACLERSEPAVEDTAGPTAERQAPGACAYPIRRARRANRAALVQAATLVTWSLEPRA